MNIWELLGISPTEDIAKIKSAYAKQAKLYHPEEHPEEFKALQNAYKLAIKLAKSRKAGSAITYLPPGEQAEELEQAEEQQRQFKENPKQTAEAVKQPTETPGHMQRTDTDFQREDAKRDADIRREGAEASTPETEGHDFDFSGVDTYGEREHFIRQFLLLAKNPYLRNRLGTWEYFLNQNGCTHLFSGTGFRKELVQTICSLGGWRRKTVLYLEAFLASFHTQENKLEDGQWETGCRAFRLKKIPRLRLPAFCTDRFFRKEGRSFQKQLHKRVSKMAGREIDLDVQLDLVRYIKLYLSYAEANEAYVDHLYRGWRFEQRMVFAVTVGVCFFAVMTGISFGQWKRETRQQMEYLTELYHLEAGTVSGEEKKELLKDYNAYWKYGEDAIDDVLERYEYWEKQ